ncbi:MAG: beta-Ala-His dipeptidase [Lachnospiraceae bacterium]
MGVLSNIAPEKVFEYFEKICSIPHGSYNEKAISDYVVSVAQEKGLKVYQDSLYNVVIIREACYGRENDEPVIIQGHLDMVCEKESDCDIDFERDGLDIYIDGDFIKARGTTLGGDDGIAVACGLALLDEPDMPRLELVFTVCEETGMEGATEIDLSMLKGRTMINLDSEEEEYFLTSCAGGLRADATFFLNRTEVTGEVVELEVSGLSGGHSGTEIHKEHGNANVIMARVLRSLPVKFCIDSIDGGLKDNAIPRQCMARIVLEDTNFDEVEKTVAGITQTLRNEMFVSDPGVTVTAKSLGTMKVSVPDRGNAVWITDTLAAFPNGVISYCQNDRTTVETSLNMGIIKTTPNELVVSFSVRSSVGSRKEELAKRLQAICEGQGVGYSIKSEYPAWEYKVESPLREKIAALYRDEYGREPIFQSIHAGLECGILSGKIQNLDCVAMGPDIFDIHTPKERLSISSTRRVYDFVRKILIAQ